MRNQLLVSLAASGLMAMHDASGHAMGRYARKDAGDEGEDGNDVVKQLSKVKAAVNEDRKTIKELVEKAEASMQESGQINEKVKAALEKASEQGTANAARFAELEQKLTALSGKAGKEGGRVKSLGDYVTEDEKVKNFLDRAKSADRANVRFDLKSLNEGTTGTGSIGDLIRPQRNPGIIEAPTRTLVVRDLLSVGRTT